MSTPPEHLGLKDLLLEGGKIALIAPRGAVPESFPTLRVFDAQAQVLAPSFIDLHVHVTGGGGEDGFSSRSPESRLTDFSTAGVTTLVGLLGTDGVARSLEALYAKVCALTKALTAGCSPAPTAIPPRRCAAAWNGISC